VAEAFAMAADVDAVVAVGVNCLDPTDAGPLVRLAGALSGKPAVVYPNSGERWDAAGRRWVGPATDLAGAVSGWLDDGAVLVGGCCRVRPDTISAIAAEVAGRCSQQTHTQL